MSSLRVGGVQFRIHPQDHMPIHAHGHYGETVAIVELLVDGSVALANRKDRIIPYDAKATDVKKILSAAAENFDRIKAAWEKMHR